MLANVRQAKGKQVLKHLINKISVKGEIRRIRKSWFKAQETGAWIDKKMKRGEREIWGWGNGLERPVRFTHESNGKKPKRRVMFKLIMQNKGTREDMSSFACLSCASCLCVCLTRGNISSRLCSQIRIPSLSFSRQHDRALRFTLPFSP